jgi:hypothetical protein
MTENAPPTMAVATATSDSNRRFSIFNRQFSILGTINYDLNPA